MTRSHNPTNDQVLELRALHKPGVRGAGYKSLARELGVGASTMRDVLTGRTAYAAGVSLARELK